MISLRRKLPKTSAERFALLVISVLVPLVVLFQLSVVFPIIHVIDIERTVSSVFLLYIFTNIAGNFWMSLLENSNTSRVFLPTVLKPGWMYCSFCQQNSPPRSYHCHLCQACVLKRDHHCTFTGNCIGFYNHRYFVMFLLHLFIGSVYCIVQNTEFVLNQVEQLDWKTIICLLLPLLSFVFQLKSHLTLTSMFVYSICIVGCFASITILTRQIIQLRRGQVGFEYSHGETKYDLGSWKKNFKTVAGSRWYIVWLLPWISSPLPGDGTVFGLDFETASDADVKSI
ncbi:probable palmitoyltransferase ZDHHC24 [Corticium candelabrum]|uniref:probable palmitoyltransferase ZDHHC24 n=1 Tax=Corticium candelabrum TaxID=121492 RepID=UPI002E25D8F4|nr:probable palmitoyltransferase ZDHHC24 [Corticium candelabrum]